jgi:hypothetical protein
MDAIFDLISPLVIFGHSHLSKLTNAVFQQTRSRYRPHSLHHPTIELES